jgi:hypothetical protein
MESEATSTGQWCVLRFPRSAATRSPGAQPVELSPRLLAGPVSASKSPVW